MEKNHKILIVDDDPVFAGLIAREIRKLGYTVFEAGDGAEGLEKVTAEQPGLVIFDVKMPRMDGYAFFRQLKKNPETRDLPLIALTSFDLMQDMFHLEGLKEYFVKSEKTEKLLAAVTRYLPAPNAPA